MVSCPACMKELPDDAHFCVQCGKDINLRGNGNSTALVVSPPTLITPPTILPSPIAVVPTVVVSTKNVGVAILLTVLFGPLGMLYSTVSGAVIMCIAFLVIGVGTLGFGLLFLWPICIIWAAVAASSYNQRLLYRR